MRLSAEDLRQIKDLFNKSVDEMLSKKEFCDKIANLISKEVEALRDHAVKLEKENLLLREKIDDLEQHSRRSSLRIHGVLEESGENVENKLLNIFSEKLGMKTGITENWYYRKPVNRYIRIFLATSFPFYFGDRKPVFR